VFPGFNEPAFSEHSQCSKSVLESMPDKVHASHVDLAMLSPRAMPADVHRAATAAMQQGCAAVVVPPVYVKRVATMLAGAVQCSAVVSFPDGTSKSTLKAIEATSCIKDGADQIDVVVHLPNLIRRDVDAVKFELLEIVRAARSTRRDVVIFAMIDSELLMTQDGDARIADACRAIRESGGDGVTARGHDAHAALPSLRKHAEGLLIKIAGRGVDWDAALRLLEAGADRVIVEELPA
jgi:deoxyribose-phosphate aldolase